MIQRILGVIFIFFTMLGYSQKPGMTCANPIEVDLNDSLVSIDSKFVPYTWYSFTLDTLNRNFVISSLNKGEYLLYQRDTITCKNGEVKSDIVVSSAILDSTKTKSKDGGLTQEELDGICTCRFCEEGGRKVSLKGGKEYLLAITGENAVFNLNTAGVKESEVWVKQEWYDMPMKAGQRLILENILFYGGETELLPSSHRDLNRLVEVMNANPDMTIEIQGHVNAPGERNTKENQDLSTGRAEAIYNYLIMHGVFANRMTFKGYGNTQMVFPDPENEWQMKRNRRVEILILSN